MVTAWGVGATAQTPAPPVAKPAAPRAASKDGAVASVGGVRISRASFDQRVREAEKLYAERSSSPIPASFRPVLRRQVLEGLIRERLLSLEAARRGIALTRDQAEEELKRDPFFQRDGILDEAKYLAIKTTQPREFENAILEIQRTLPARRLKDEIERQNRPDASALKAEIERQLSSVTIDFLALRRAAFSSDHPEPTEREVIEYHRAHASEFRRPEEARLTLVTVNRPALTEADRSSPAALQAWEGRIRARAESLLSAIRSGANLEELAPGFGTVGTERVERDKFPASWRGDAGTRQKVFSTRPGQWLDELIPGPSGVLLARVEERLPERSAALGEVIATIRGRLRAEAIRRRDDREMQAIYEGLRDSLRGTAYRIRYAAFDTATVKVADPTQADLDRYYRSHLADYSFFDAKSGSVGARPFSEVVGEVRGRLLRERRAAATRSAADQLLALWQAGKRDPKLERTAATLREVGPIVVGAMVDTGFAGQVLTDSLSLRPGLGASSIRTARGWVVYHAFAQERDFTPPFDQARPILAQRLGPLRSGRLEAEARKLYEADPRRFRAADAVHFSRVMVNPPDPLTIPITRVEVEDHYKAHLEEYGAPELVRVRHLLVTPRDDSPQADAEARREAEDLLRRVNAGGSFETLAREHSDDEATRDKGGDLGVFRHGMMLEDFERVAFAMKRGEVRGPVRTEVGYHVIECLEHVEAETTPLKYCYGNVASDVAKAKSERYARFRADSLLRVLRTPAQARQVAERMRLLVFRNEHVIGSPVAVSALRDYFTRLERLKPGQFDSQPQEYSGMGHAITWVDSIVPPRKVGWEQVRNDALEQYRIEADRARMFAKRAELDSLRAAGWSFDSLRTLFGGFERHGPRGPGSGLERLSGRQLLDSLAFGTKTSPPALQVGKVTDWIEFPAGLVMMRLEAREGPEAVQLATRMETDSRAALERNLRAAFDRMKRRFPVEIHDSELRITDLPPVPDS